MKEIPEMTDKQRLFCAILSVTLSISSMIVVLTKPKTIVHKADVVVPRAVVLPHAPSHPAVLDIQSADSVPAYWHQLQNDRHSR